MWLTRLESPLAAYYLVLGATVGLVAIGLVMVLSSSSVESYRENAGNSYAVFAKQAMFAAIGLPMAWVAAIVPIRWWKGAAWPLIFIGAGGLVAVAVAGVSINGNQNWLQIGSMTVQPSESVKLALVVWSATVLGNKRQLLSQTSHVVVPVVPVTVLLLGLVLLGNDLGTALVLIGIVASLLFISGAPIRVFLAGGLATLATVAMLVLTSSNRRARIAAWAGQGECDLQDNCWQATHGLYGLSTGGWWGVGLGKSREKWSWLPEAHNDFIFAVIGEELGLAGTLVVLALFAALAIGLFRLVLTSDDVFVKIATGGVLAWVLGQAMINIGAVLRMLPIIGVPLPLVSSGGSALVTTLVALGMVLGFARRVPGAPEALAARGAVVKRSIAVLPRRLSGRLPGRSSGQSGHKFGQNSGRQLHRGGRR